MYVSALSATSTTGLFTLAGALVGAGIGGSVTLVLEIMRRRWQQKDESGNSQKERLETLIKERKDLYPRLLAKGNELENTIAMERVKKAANKVPGERPPSANRDHFIYESVSRIYEISGPCLEEFENLRAQAEIIAGKEVARLVNEWDRYLSNAYSKAILFGAQPEGENPYKPLVKAIKRELGYSEDLYVPRPATPRSSPALIDFSTSRPDSRLRRTPCQPHARTGRKPETLTSTKTTTKPP